MVRRRLMVCSAALTACLLAGCGAGVGDVSGELKYRGNPLAGATVTFYDANNKAISDVVAADGKYAVKGVATGMAKIAIATPLPIQFPGGLSGAKGEGGATQKSEVPAIPAKYNDRAQSGLTFDVKSGPQVHNINLD